MLENGEREVTKVLLGRKKKLMKVVSASDLIVSFLRFKRSIEVMCLSGTF